MIQAKDISISLVLDTINERGYITRYDLIEELGLPQKVVTAKLAKMVKRKILDGCGGETCDCGTPFSVRK